MDEKSIKQEQEQPVAKKAYTPPTVTVYGKLTELTAGGTSPMQENMDNPGRNPKG